MKLSNTLLINIKSKLPELEQLLLDVCGHWNYEDYVYRFYHNSFKVYYTQELTAIIVEKFHELMPELELNRMFVNIINSGTGKKFKMDDNLDWENITRPILEALMHAKYFLEMIVKYGKELDESPNCMPSGWASVLYLFNIR
jgi:hypothetical protein